MEVKTIEVGNEKTKTLADFLEKDLSRLLLALLVKSTLPKGESEFSDILLRKVKFIY